MNDAWSHDVSTIRSRIAELDEKTEELLAAGPIAPGIVEAVAEMAHEAARLTERLTAPEGEPAEPTEPTRRAPGAG